VTGTWLRHRGLCPGPCQGRRQRTKVSVEGLCLSTRVRTSKSDERSKIDVIKLCVWGGVLCPALEVSIERFTGPCEIGTTIAPIAHSDVRM
jgi:hypothetical protein